MALVIEDYLKFFPTDFFLCSDNTHSMHFVFSLNHIPDVQQKNLAKLMKHCGAEISFNLKDITGYSAIIVDHNELIRYGPVFTIKYIESCLLTLKIQDISFFRQDITKNIDKNLKCMDVVYFRNRDWKSVMTALEELWLEEYLLEIEEPPASSSSDDTLSPVKSRLETDQHNGASHPKEMLHKNNKTYILSSDDDSELEDINDQTNLNEVQQGASNIQENSKPNSDHAETIKENTHLKTKALNSTSGDGAATNSDNITGVKRKQRGETNTTSTGPSSSKWTFMDHSQLDSSDEEVPPKVVKKKKEENFFDFDAAEENVNKPNKNKKRTRRPYTFEEQSTILKYVVFHNEFSRIKGRELWMVMERRKICPNRTWQSMKEHFLKKILCNLESFDFLTEAYKLKLKH